jgi:hypothetical protein
MTQMLAGSLAAIILLAGCGSEEPTLDQGRAAWNESEGSTKEDLARTCRAMTASELGSASAQIRQGVESVDLDALIGRIDAWYDEDRPRPGAIGEVCFAETQDLAVTATQSEIEDLTGP